MHVALGNGLEHKLMASWTWSYELRSLFDYAMKVLGASVKKVPTAKKLQPIGISL